MRFLAIMGLFASLFGGGCKQTAQSQQSAAQQPQMSQRLADIAFLALNHGIYSIQDGEDPLIPFVISEQAEGKRKLSRYVSEATVGDSKGWVLEESLAQARLAVSQLPSSVTAYAIAHDGYITIEGTKYDAIFVEASERGRTAAVIMAQRYIPKTAQQSFQRVGNPALLREEDSRLR
jgi:hypothetical protein